MTVLPPLFIEEKSWRQNGLVLLAKFFKVTAKSTCFGGNYKSSKFSNLTKGRAYYGQNRKIVHCNPNFHRPFHDVRKAAQKDCPSLHRSSIFPRRYRLSFHFCFVTEGKSISAVYQIFTSSWGGQKGALRPWPYCSNLKCSDLKMLRPKYAWIIHQSMPFVNWQFA